jgi:hypothetical protein
MTSHLSPDDHVAALDGTLSADRLAHVSGCAACQETLARTRSIVDALRSDDVPEPSPLFWEHFSARVRTATEAGVAAASPRFGWRAWVTIASAAAAFMIMLIVRLAPDTSSRPVSHPPQVAAVGASATRAEASETEPLTAVLQMASSLSSDDLSGVVSAAGGQTPLVEDLSPAERAAFVRLLHAEMEKVQ